MNNRGLRIIPWVRINRNEPVRDLTDPLLPVVESSEMVGEDLKKAETNALDTTVQGTSNLALEHLVVTGHTNHLTLLGDAPLLSLS
jgi:hypothetical protein